MKLTKYEHACVVLQDQDKRLVIDPGAFTSSFGGTDNIVAVVVTHAHQDHYDARHLDAIFADNPEAVLFTTQEVATQYQHPHTVVVHDGQSEMVGPFKLDFSGDLHALITQTLPQLQNTAVSVNDVFFYPGDSYTPPAITTELLAVPLDAPWMRISESMDYITQVKPNRAFATHDALLSDIGHGVYGASLQQAADAAGVELMMLNPGDSTEL